MKPIMRTLLFLVVMTVSLFGRQDLADLAGARRILPSGLWSKPLRIRNVVPMHGYPKNVHALVFEFGDVLWLYTPYDGTQSLSHNVGKTSEDKARLGELLGEVFQGYRGHDIIEEELAACRTPSAEPRNVCFLRSIAALFKCCSDEAKVREAALLSYYYSGSTNRGHTVLVYRTDEGTFMLDPGVSEKPVPLASSQISDPMTFANAAEGQLSVAKARFFKISLSLIGSIARSLLSPDLGKRADYGVVGGI
jgi:hypothetical protein